MRGIRSGAGLDQQPSELDLLRAQVAELTSRVYRLELALEGKSASTAEPKFAAAPKPARPPCRRLLWRSGRQTGYSRR
jgi:hypothetical protein